MTKKINTAGLKLAVALAMLVGQGAVTRPVQAQGNCTNCWFLYQRCKGYFCIQAGGRPYFYQYVYEQWACYNFCGQFFYRSGYYTGQCCSGVVA